MKTFPKITQDPNITVVLNKARMLGFEPEVFANTNMTSLQRLFEGKCILKLSKREFYVVEKH